jgi:hypothetical protein
MAPREVEAPHDAAIEPALAQEAERVRVGLVWLVGGATVALSALLVAIAWWLVAPPAMPRAAAPSTLERGLFEQATGGIDARAAGAARLTRYEWVDRNARVVHIPIDRAIDAVVANPNLIRAGSSANENDAGAAGFGEAGR